MKKNMIELNRYEHICYWIKAYSAANLMGLMKYAYLPISQFLNHQNMNFVLWKPVICYTIWASAKQEN